MTEDLPSAPGTAAPGSRPAGDPGAQSPSEGPTSGASPAGDTASTGAIPLRDAGAAPEPPPLTAFAWRNGLVRPTQGRLLAGVCGAFGRATNTDPVLWRVVIAVLTIFAGIGALVYLIAWLILPADGDTASPIEALAGRGRSATSTALTIIGSLIVVFSLAAYVSEPFRATPLLALILLGGVLLLLLRDQQRGRARPAATPGWPAVPPRPTATQPYGPAPTAAATGSMPPPGSYPAMPAPGSPGGTGFAPHGPFAPPPPPPPPPPYAGPPRPRSPRSRLGRLTLSIVLLVIGALAVANLTGLFHVPPLAFLATALGLVGLGLLVGTWFGRSRGLIALGIVLSFLLGTGAVANWHGGWTDGWWHRSGTVTWTPASLESVQSSYRHGAGDATLDLSSVDFSKAPGPVEVTVQVDVGSLKIRVPSYVDVVADTKVDVGNAQVFRERWDGLGQDARTVTDLGPDGAGGGQLRLVARVNVGDLEVSR